MAINSVLEPAVAHILCHLRGERYTADILDNFKHVVTFLSNSQDFDVRNEWGRYLKAHGKRVQTNSVKLGRALGLRPQQIAKLAEASYFHDIGKSVIPSPLLSASKCLETANNRITKMHTVLGAELIGIIHPDVDLVKTIQHHHERWDGKGYPSGLKGEAIPVNAQIIAVANHYDALVHTTPCRVYKLTPRQAIEELMQNAGTRYNPIVVATFAEIMASEVNDELDNNRLSGVDEKLFGWRERQKCKRKWEQFSVESARYEWEEPLSSLISGSKQTDEQVLNRQVVYYERIAVESKTEAYR